MTSVFVSGVLGLAMADEPGLPWGEGRFSPLLPKLLVVLAALTPRSPPIATAVCETPTPGSATW
jgi:hypothetical protein